MNAKAQTTLFLVIGLLILIVIIAMFFLAKSSLLTEVLIYPELKETEQALNYCVQDKIDNALLLIGMQGGYIHPNNFLELGFANISYNLPSLNEMEQELSMFIKEEIQACLPELENITENEASVNVKLNNKVLINIDWKLVVKTDDKLVQLKLENFEKDIDFIELHNNLKKIREGYVTDIDAVKLYVNGSNVYSVRQQDYVFLTAVT